MSTSKTAKKVKSKSKRNGAKKSVPKRSKKSKTKLADVPVEGRHDMIMVAAYYIAEKRGFEPGHDEDDWLVAEAEVDIILKTSD